jgi:hypothetical protein
VLDDVRSNRVDLVPPLKGLTLKISAYPALKRWAKLFRASGARFFAIRRLSRNPIFSNY